MSRALPWVLVGLLALSSLAHGVALFHTRGPAFTTQPILVPVSSEHEKAMRAARNQPAGAGGEDVLPILLALEKAELDPAVRSAVAPKVEALRQTRQRLLDLRNQRHKLNTRLMGVGVEVARELTPAQWDVLTQQRDATRGRAEDAVFERVLGELR